VRLETRFSSAIFKFFEENANAYNVQTIAMKNNDREYWSISSGCRVNCSLSPLYQAADRYCF